MQLTAPDSWLREHPASFFVLAEFLLPRAKGDSADARLTLTAVGGTVEENIVRWRAQFESQASPTLRKEREIAGIKVTLVHFAGTFEDRHGRAASAVDARSGYEMRVAILHLPRWQHIIKCYGPKNTMDKHEAAFDKFLHSLEPLPSIPDR